eukprot:1184295-Prorocentrum_minimum.AAC.2
MSSTTSSPRASMGAAAYSRCSVSSFSACCSVASEYSSSAAVARALACAAFASACACVRRAASARSARLRLAAPCLLRLAVHVQVKRRRLGHERCARPHPLHPRGHQLRLRLGARDGVRAPLVRRARVLLLLLRAEQVVRARLRQAVSPLLPREPLLRVHLLLLRRRLRHALVALPHHLLARHLAHLHGDVAGEGVHQQLCLHTRQRGRVDHHVHVARHRVHDQVRVRRLMPQRAQLHPDALAARLHCQAHRDERRALRLELDDCLRREQRG